MSPMGVSLDSTNEIVPEIADHILVRRIGTGGYGEVWLARNRIGGLRAVKVIYRRRFMDERPYKREFEGICKFEPISRTHPGLVTILQVGENAAAGYFYYVMELADDARTVTNIDPDTYVPRTLAEDLKLHRRPPLETSFQIALSLASALAHLHAQNLIHRDIKPSNIIFVNGVPKIADVGLVTTMGENVSDVGSRPYMPPEEPGEPTGDIFSFGKVLYELFMGLPCKRYPELPDEAEEFTSVPALLRVNSLILKACHSDRRQRFQTANELYAALLAVAQTAQIKPAQTKRLATASGPDGSDNLSLSIQAGAIAPTPARTPAPAGLTPQGRPVESSERPTSVRWSRRAALFVLLPAIPGAAIFFMTRRKPDTTIPSGGPVIFLMDTVAPRGVYDPDNIRKGRSNADELLERLGGLDGIVSLANLNKEAIGLDWARDSFVAAKRPDIVIIHRSSFFHPYAAELNLAYPSFDDDADGEKLRKWQAHYDSQDTRLHSLIWAVGAASPHTQFLIYSTGTDQRWLKPEFRSNWVHKLELALPDLEGRINTMVIEPQPGGKKGTFRDPATMEKMRAQVREMIKKLEKRKTEKPN